MIICCGEALIDMVPVPVYGKTGGFLPLPGGSPFNTAISIGKLGVPVKFLGRISTDFFGDMLIKRFKDNRVGDDLIKRSGQNSTLAFVKLAKGKEPQYVFYVEETADRSFSVADLPENLPSDTNCIVFGSISMTMEPIASAIEALILREATRKSTDQMDGAPVISFDPNIRAMMIKDRPEYIGRFEKWVAASTIVKFSSGDLSFIYPNMEADRVLQKAIAMGPRLAICTQGAKGAMALLRLNNGNVVRASAPAASLPIVDTIGAGDAFHGAFLSWLEIKGKMSRSALVNLSETELYTALLFASKAAALVCSRQGADPPSRREVESLKLPALKVPAKKASQANKASGKEKIKEKAKEKKKEKEDKKSASPKAGTGKQATAKKSAKKN